MRNADFLRVEEMQPVHAHAQPNPESRVRVIGPDRREWWPAGPDDAALPGMIEASGGQRRRAAMFPVPGFRLSSRTAMP